MKNNTAEKTKSLKQFRLWGIAVIIIIILPCWFLFAPGYKKRLKIGPIEAEVENIKTTDTSSKKTTDSIKGIEQNIDAKNVIAPNNGDVNIKNEFVLHNKDVRAELLFQNKKIY